MSDLLFPILDTLGRPSAEHVDDELRNHTFVGMIAAQFYWRAIFRNILPRDSNGIYVVMSNPCSGAFTYKINGPSAQYVGPLDRHETKYDGITSSSRLQDLGNFAMRDSVYLGVPMDSDYCPLMVHLYPSDEMHDDHTTSRPIMLSISVVLIFAFTSLVFFFYDAKVERRQQTVMTTAVNSSALVSSLFPAAVRDQLYASDLAVRCENASGTKDKILRNTTLGDETSMKSEDKLGFATAPIAELYPDTTVLFADIVGFTAWSSEREPTQVFTLLETLYAAFDGIAKQRGVFKVETIGDCYVAVVGLPTPRKHHAVVMARFANDCRKKMHELTAKLETLLGLVSTILRFFHSLANVISNVLTYISTF